MIGLDSDIALLANGWPNTGARIVAHMRAMRAELAEAIDHANSGRQAEADADRELAKLRDQIDSFAADLTNPLFQGASWESVAQGLRDLINEPRYGLGDGQ